jgi:hypothetical protein
MEQRLASKEETERKLRDCIAILELALRKAGIPVPWEEP